MTRCAICKKVLKPEDKRVPLSAFKAGEIHPACSRYQGGYLTWPAESPGQCYTDGGGSE